MRYRIVLPAIAATVALLQGCGGGSSDDAEPTPTPVVTPQAVVLTSDFPTTGSFATIDLEPPRAVTPGSAQRAVDPDAVARVIDGRLYIINRSEATIQVRDPSDDYATVSECDTGDDSNPHDIAVVSDSKAYVTLYNETDLLIVDPSVEADCAGFVRGRIDLSVFADADGIPEMDLMAIIGARLYVSIQHLDRRDLFAPTGLGQIAVIDIASDSVIGEIALGAQNPFGVTKGLTVDGNDLLVPLTGIFGDADGGIQRVDAVNQELGPFIITEEQLGGDVTDFVIFSATIGYAVISKADFTNAVVRFNPATGRLTQTVLNADFIADIELNDRDELYVSDRSSGSLGVRIFAASDGSEITSCPRCRRCAHPHRSRSS
jgi:hypothetical protein